MLVLEDSGTYLTDAQYRTDTVPNPGRRALSPARWHDKHTYLSSLGMLGTTQLIFFADHIIFNTGHMKHADSWQIMANDNNNNKKTKFDTSDNPGLLSYATTVILKFKLK